MTNPERVSSHSQRFIVVLGVLGSLVMVFSSAWVAEDAFINFRIAYMMHDGYGPVFNIGQRVQVFTSPAWQGVQWVGAVLGFGPYIWSIGIGLGLTALLFWLLGRYLTSKPQGTLAFVAACVGLLSSDTFLAFQTGGLEDSALTLSIVLLFLWVARQQMAPDKRATTIGALLSSLLLLIRPDALFLCAPILVYLVWSSHFRNVWRVVLGLLPVMAWEVFSLIYYGQLIPNTATAKVGMFSSTHSAIRQGIIYVADWVHYEPIQALAVMVGIYLAWTLFSRNRSWRNGAILSLVLGVVLQFGYVIWVGGDYMRGRFLDPVLVGGVVLGALAISEVPNLKLDRLALFAFAALAFGTYFIRMQGIAAEAVIQPTGIVNERAFWQAQGQSLSLFNRPRDVSDPGLTFRAYAEKYGPITVSNFTIGQFAYFAGPKVTVLDPFGLSSPFVARMPVSPGSRVGHADHLAPKAYYASMHDVADLPNYQQRVASMDPTLRLQALAQVAVWHNAAQRRLAQDVQIITEGPIWSAVRWHLILQNLVPLHW